MPWEPSHLTILHLLDASTLRGKERKKYQVEKAVKLGAKVLRKLYRGRTLILPSLAAEETAASQGYADRHRSKGQGEGKAGERKGNDRAKPPNGESNGVLVGERDGRDFGKEDGTFLHSVKIQRFE